MPHRKRVAARRAGSTALMAIAAALVLSLGMPHGVWAHASAAAPRPGPGNKVSMGSRASGLYFDYTLTGAECGEPRSDGGVTCILTSDKVAVSGTMYLSGDEGSFGVQMYARLSPFSGSKGDVIWPWNEGWVSNTVEGPFEHEESFAFTYEVDPEYGGTIDFSVGVSRVSSASENLAIGVAMWIYPLAATETPEVATPVPTVTGPRLPSGYKPPCDIPLFFYPDQDLSRFYTGLPSLRYTQDELVTDLQAGLQRYAAGKGATVTDGALPWDVADIAQTFTQDAALPDGKKVAPALQQAARDLARSRQESDPTYRVSPGDLLELSLKLNGGNVRNALITCHAALYRDKKGVNKGFVEKEGILAPLRNADAYADTEWTYTTPQGKTRTANPHTIGQDEQGPWYHLYGVAALEYTDGYGAASYYGAQAWMWIVGDKTKQAALDKIKAKGFPITGLGGVLGDWSLALEEGIRSLAGKPPDIDKNCINYWALKAGHELRRLVNNPQLVSPPPDEWTPGGRWRQDGDRVYPLGHGKHATFRSPLSLRIDGANGEWFSFDQTTKQFDGNTPLVVFDFFPEEDGTLGLVAQPLFEVSSMRLTATGSGPAQIATYDPATGKTEAYELTVQPGDQITLSGQDEPALLNGSPLEPAATRRAGKPFPIVPVVAGTGGALLLAAIGAVVLRHGSQRARRADRVAGAARPAPTQEAHVPMAAAPGYRACQTCRNPLKPGIRFCGNCGAAVPEAPPVCPQCGRPVNPGARFCGVCGKAIR